MQLTIKLTVKPTEKPAPIDYFSLDHPLRGLASKVALGARKKMYAFFTDKLTPDQQSLIVDVGVTPDQSLIDSNFFEALYPHPEMITATSIEDASFMEQVYPGLKFVRTGAGKLPFEDKSFDIAVSFAVLEHVGDTDNQRSFIRELLRISKKAFITTPDRSFPVEVHTFLPFIHWLPQPTHQSILQMLGLKFWSKTENLNLLNRKTLLELFPDNAKVDVYHHKLLGFSSNLMAVVSDSVH
jgi:SAM-dependent methyltransferase